MVVIAEEVFGEIEPGFSSEGIVLFGVFDEAAAEAALRRIGERFMLVDERGTEHPDLDGWWPVGDDGVELYTPNFVSDPESVGGGLELHVDCKSEIREPMRERFLAILEEELSGLGDSVFVVCDPMPPDDFDDDLAAWQPDRVADLRRRLGHLQSLPPAS